MGPAMGSSSPDTERVLPERIALHVVEPSSGAASIAVLLCCAEADADALAEQMERLDVADVRLVSGLERDTVALRDELAAMKQQSLVVVCKTDALGADAVRRAVECFGLRRTWTHRLLVLELPSQHSTSWIGSVHRTLAAMARRRARPTEPMIEIASVQGEIVGNMRDPARPPSSDEPAVVLASARAMTSRRDEVGPIPAYVRAPGHRVGHLALVGPVDDVAEETAATSDACLLPPAVPPVVPTRLRRRWAIPGGLAAILAAAIVGTFVAPKLSADGPMHAPVLAAMPNDVERIAAVHHVVPPPAPAAASANAPAPERDDSIVIVVPPAADDLDDAFADGRAIRHDDWIVWTQPEPAEDWWRAANLCRARTLAGLRGWRLPTITEARALRRAGVLPKVDSWTITRIVDGEGNWVAVADGRFEARDKHESSAHATCLRRG